MNLLSTESIQTMTSLEISDLVESRHDSVKRTIERCAEKGAISLPPLVEVKVQRERRDEVVSVYRLDKRSSLIVVAQLCPEFTARIVDRWQELEARATLSHKASGPLREELEAVDVLSRILNVAPSGKISMVKASLTHHGAAHLVPLLPVYAIDAPPSKTTAPTSSAPTASLTELLKEHDIGVSAVAANKMLAKAGLIEELTRPSSSGRVKKFWSVTEKGDGWGKNVTSPNNPKETQPHWYRNTFPMMVREYLG